MASKASAVFDAVVEALFWAAGVVLFLGALAVCADVLMRYFLNQPLGWVTEVTENLILFTTFMGSTWLLRKEGHVKIDVLFRLLSHRNQALATTVTSFICAIPCLLIVWYGGQVVADHYQRKIYLATTLKLSTAPLLSIVVVGNLLLFIQFLRRGSRHWALWRSMASGREGSILSTRLES